MPASEGEPEMKYFADTTYLGDLDTDYPLHFNKKTNHEDPAIANDFSVIRNFIDENNYSPSLGEIGGALGLSSVATVHKHVSHLVQKGFSADRFLASGSGFARPTADRHRGLVEHLTVAGRVRPPGRGASPCRNRQGLFSG